MVRECKIVCNVGTAFLLGRIKASRVVAFLYIQPKGYVWHQLIGSVLRHNSSSELTKNPYNTMKIFSSRKGLQESEARFYLYTHKHTLCACARAHTTIKQSLFTAESERLVQAFFNMTLTPDISFVSIIIRSRFAASRSCQNPYSQTLCITPFCKCCQSLFHTGHEHLTLHPQQDLNKGAQRKGSCRQGNRSNREAEQVPQRMYLHKEISASSHPPTSNRKHLACISLERDDQPVSGLCTVQNF